MRRGATTRQVEALVMDDGLRVSETWDRAGATERVLRTRVLLDAEQVTDLYGADPISLGLIGVTRVGGGERRYPVNVSAVLAPLDSTDQ